ncbi:hypothetical protein [Cylindrospermum stagnale]|uniref:hypothetical protein n=1 Tax=Cylindrospermum stagnale TaxID=142864 RepID=UPI0012F6889B|nr:hypothetical protein [Cylindrospermum stagnale]
MQSGYKCDLHQSTSTTRRRAVWLVAQQKYRAIATVVDSIISTGLVVALQNPGNRDPKARS